MKDNALEKKLRKFKEDLWLNLEVKYLGKRKEPGSGDIKFTYLVTFIRPESETPYFIETLSALVYSDQIRRPCLSEIFRSFLATPLPDTGAGGGHGTKCRQALRSFFIPSEIEYLQGLIFEPGTE